MLVIILLIVLVVLLLGGYSFMANPIRIEEFVHFVGELVAPKAEQEAKQLPENV